MKIPFLILATWIASWIAGLAAPSLDTEDFAKNLGGWKKRDHYVDYPLSGADYRTYKPEISPTPDGGIYISVRIDHRRGWLSSNDHATLDITVSPKGVIESAQSTIAIQGQSIASDVIVGSNEAGKQILTPERAVQIGTDLISNLTAKLLLENIVEAGRVSFPSVLRHNYNRLFQAIRVEGVVVPAAVAVADAPVVPPPAPVPAPAIAPSPTTPSAPAPAPATAATPAAPAAPAAPASTPAPAKPGSAPLEIKPYN